MKTDSFSDTSSRIVNDCLYTARHLGLNSLMLDVGVKHHQHDVALQVAINCLLERLKKIEQKELKISKALNMPKVYFVESGRYFITLDYITQFGFTESGRRIRK